MAEGEQCENPEDPTTCQRAVRLLPVVNNRFTPGMVYLEDGTCIGPAHFDLNRQEAAALGTGWDRLARARPGPLSVDAHVGQ